MMRILITGSAGFFGWNAVRHFTGRGYDVVAGFHTLPHYLHNVAGCQPVALDIADGAATAEVVNRFRPDLILHAAALARPQVDTDLTCLRRVNVQGTTHVARAAADGDIPIVYISTDLVYPSDSGICDEESPVDPSPAAPYAASKLQGEASVRAVAGRWIIIRPSLMYGSGSPRSGGFNAFIERTWSEGKPVPLFVDQFRSFLYVDDLSRAVEHGAMFSDRWNEVYVCGGSERLSRADFGLRYAAARGVDSAMCRLMRADELEGYVGGASDISLDTSRLRSTGWVPTSLDEAFQRMLHERAVVT